jgi:hypothetical protein
MLEFKSSSLQFKFNAVDCNVKFPTIKSLKEFRQKTKDMGEESSIDQTIEFLCGLGLQREVAEALEVQHLQKIIDSLTGESKKN